MFLFNNQIRTKTKALQKLTELVVLHHFRLFLIFA